MKNKFVFAGLVAVGAAGLQTTFAENLDLISPKCWNVSGTLRGFYDDNYNISGTKKGSYGAEVSPQISVNVPLRQTDIGLRYTYGAYYYQDRQDLGVDAFDQTHQVDIWVDHAFNERWKANVTDSFAVGQEPDLITPGLGSAQAVVYRVNGNNIANHAGVKLDTEWTRQFSTSVKYGNNYYDYSNKGNGLNTIPFNPPYTSFPSVMPGVPGTPGWQGLNNSPSLAGLLNRVEQNAALDLQWHFQPETMVFVGYNFSWVQYNGNEPIGVYNYLNSGTVAIIAGRPVLIGGTPRSIVYKSDSRDSRTQYGYVGVQHQFTPNLTGTLRGGVSYTDNYNDPLQNTTDWAPYGDLSVSYTYLPGSYVQVGATQDINASDIASVSSSNGSLTQYQESSVGYASINHRITQDLMATIIGRCQYSKFKGGSADSQTQTDYSFGINLHYQINRHFSADAGYNYDTLVTDSNVTDPGYTRNRVYLGLGANY